MNLQDKTMKVIQEGLNTAFNFDDIVDAPLEDIKITKTPYSYKDKIHDLSVHKLSEFVNQILNDTFTNLTIEQQNDLFLGALYTNITYKFKNNNDFKTFIHIYTELNPTANLNWIDTSNITDMSNLFMDSEFNGDISLWDVSSVTNMTNMFTFSEFNGDISSWDVSSVTGMHGMFNWADFQGDISSWDVSNVTDMSDMFIRSKFNGNISNWNVSNVLNMSNMFRETHYFNSDISSWNVSNVVNMFCMFSQSSFNRDISKWNVSNVTDSRYMFRYCRIKPEFKPFFNNHNDTV